jgi:hypothetical protein
LTEKEIYQIINEISQVSEVVEKFREVLNKTDLVEKEKINESLFSARLSLLDVQTRMKKGIDNVGDDRCST